MNQSVDKTKAIIESVRSQCMQRGLGTIKGLGVLFRQIDKDFSKTITLKEMKSGFKKFGIKVKKDEIETLFKGFDADKSGKVDFKEFLKVLQPPMSANRVAVVNETFNKLDANSNGILDVEDLKVTYHQNAKNHPKFISGEWTLERVLQGFLDAFDSDEGKDGKVTKSEFLQYYAAVSTTMEDDAYFDLLMRSCWGLPQRGSRK